MSSFRTSLSSMRQRSEGSPWVTLLAGLIVGLLLGLLIGWVVWPVEWQGAYLSDLVPEARAEYVSAVADSYFAYSSEAARQEAIQRLTGFQGGALAEIDAAMAYYRARPNPQNEIRIHNLAQLANALGGQANPAMAQVMIPATSESVANGSSSNEVPVATIAIANPSTVALSDAANETGWFSWLLTLFAGLLLLGGGLYLLQRLRQGSDGLFATGSGARVVGGKSSIDDDYSFDEEPDFAEALPTARQRTTQTPWLEEGDLRAQPAPSARRSPWNESLEEPTFEEDGEDEDLPAQSERWQEGNDRPSSPSATSASNYRWQAESDDGNAEYNEADWEEEDEEIDAPQVEESPYRRSVQSTSAASERYPDSYRQESEDDLTDEEEEEDNPFDDAPPTARSVPPTARHRNLEDRTPPRSENRLLPTRTGSASSPRFPGSKSVGSFDCVYMAGMGDYDESFNVADPVTKNYIGECGMGVSTKNRILHKNPDEVIALEVWLFDKADGSSLSTQMRVLMSEFASDRYSDVFSKERSGESRPFVPQSGVKFQLEGPTLILNGEVIEASYTREGIFQNVKVHMEVLRR